MNEIEKMWKNKIGKIRDELDNIQNQLKELDSSMETHLRSGKFHILEGKEIIAIFQKDLKETSKLISIAYDKLSWIQQMIEG